MSYTKLTGRPAFGDTILSTRYKITDAVDPGTNSKCYDMLQQKYVAPIQCQALTKGGQPTSGALSRFAGGLLSSLLPTTPTSPTPGQAAMPAPSGRPAWLLPAAVGGGALILLLILKKRKR